MSEAKEVGLRTVSYHYKEIDMIKWCIDIYDIYEDSFIDINSPFGGKHIGNAVVYFYDASRKSPYKLRMEANVHTKYSQFEVLNSVRIFSADYEYEDWMYSEDQSLDEGELDYTDFSPEELESIKSWTEYDDNTINVYGKLVCLDKIKIFSEYRNQGYGSLALQQLIEYFGKIGMDFLLLKPHPIEKDNIENEKNRLEYIQRLIGFYRKNGFEETKGKLLENYCMVKSLDI